MTIRVMINQSDIVVSISIYIYIHTHIYVSLFHTFASNSIVRSNTAVLRAVLRAGLQEVKAVLQKSLVRGASKVGFHGPLKGGLWVHQNSGLSLW